MRTFAWALIVGAALVGACSDGNITTGNSPPSATILTPSDGVAVSQSQPLQLSGVVGDRGTAVLDLRVTWTSSAGGLLFDGSPDDTAGNTRFLWNTPAAGTQDITLAVIDPGGVSATATVRVTIIGNVAPTCAITAPSDGVAVSSASPLLFQGQVGDAEETPETLLIEWVSNIDGAFGATAPTSAGVVSTTRTLSPGLHSITLTVRDGGDQTCMDTILVPVNAPPSGAVAVLLHW